jgi:hypothetical protein
VLSQPHPATMRRFCVVVPASCCENPPVNKIDVNASPGFNNLLRAFVASAFENTTTMVFVFMIDLVKVII